MESQKYLLNIMETTTCLNIRFATIHSRMLLKSYITKPSSACLQSSSGNNPEQHVKPRLWTYTGNAMTWGLSNTPELAPNSLNWHDLRVVCCQWKIVTINSITQLALYPRLFGIPSIQWNVYSFNIYRYWKVTGE